MTEKRTTRTTRTRRTRRRTNEETAERSGNLVRLERAGILRKGAVLTAREEAVLASLSDQEIATVIAVREKLGASFLRRHVKKGSDLIF